MRILVQDLPQGHSSLDRRESAEGLGLHSWFHPRGPIRVRLDSDRRGEQITLRGRVEVEAECECSRCTRSVVFPICADILVVADRSGTDAPEDEAALEQEGSIIYHDGSELNLERPLREALVLEVSHVTLCRPDCKGLCPQCGQDRNEASCNCAPPSGDPRWEALRDLKES